MFLTGNAMQDYFPAMTAIETPKAVVRGPNDVHRQPQGEQYAEHSVHGAGGSGISTAVASFTVNLASLFAT